jgi:hypothetical protein
MTSQSRLRHIDCLLAVFAGCRDVATNLKEVLGAPPGAEGAQDSLLDHTHIPVALVVVKTTLASVCVTTNQQPSKGGCRRRRRADGRERSVHPRCARLGAGLLMNWVYFISVGGRLRKSPVESFEGKVSLKSPQNCWGRVLLRLPKSCLTYLKHTLMNCFS